MDRVTVTTGSKEGTPEYTVIWLHGLGADGHDFEPIVPALGLPGDLSVRFVFPHAPERPVTVNNGAVMRAWYDILGLEVGRDHDKAGILESARLIEELIAEEKKRGTPASRIVLAGFSQGGAMACHVGLRHQERLAGILILSGYLLFEDRLEAQASAANRETPVFQCHGLFDPVVPLESGRASAEALQSRGFPVLWKTYPTPHSVHPTEVEDIGVWLQEVLVASA